MGGLPPKERCLLDGRGFCVLAGGMSGQAGAWAAVMHKLIFSDPRVVEKQVQANSFFRG